MEAIWVVLLLVIGVCLFLMGCTLADSQRNSEDARDAGGIKLVVNLDWGTAKHTSVTYHDSLLHAQATLNSYSFPQIKSAVAIHTQSGLRYVMDYNGILKPSKVVNLNV